MQMDVVLLYNFFSESSPIQLLRTIVFAYEFHLTALNFTSLDQFESSSSASTSIILFHIILLLVYSILILLCSISRKRLKHIMTFCILTQSHFRFKTFCSLATSELILLFSFSPLLLLFLSFFEIQAT